MRVFALHGIPTDPTLFTTLPWPSSWTIDAPPLPTVEAGGPGPFDLLACAAELEGPAAEADLVLGHDLGGVLAAMVRRRGQALVLTGTSLSPLYWRLMGMTAWPVLHHYFYRRHAGTKFLHLGTAPEARDEVRRRFGDHGPGWAERMRRVARGLRLPDHLDSRLTLGPSLLLWGQEDPWYPAPAARALARRTGSAYAALGGRHLLPAERPQAFIDELLHWWDTRATHPSKRRP